MDFKIFHLAIRTLRVIFLKLKLTILIELARSTPIDLLGPSVILSVFSHKILTDWCRSMLRISYLQLTPRFGGRIVYLQLTPFSFLTTVLLWYMVREKSPCPPVVASQLWWKLPWCPFVFSGTSVHRICQRAAASRTPAPATARCRTEEITTMRINIMSFSKSIIISSR